MPKNIIKSGLHYETSTTEFIYPGLDKIMLPLSLSISLKNGRAFHKLDRKIITSHKVLESLLNIVKKRNLPEYYAYETMRRLLKMNKYLYSYKHQVIELISVLQQTNDERLKNHINDLCKEINYVKRI